MEIKFGEIREGIMRGFIYRWSVRIKDFGERLARVPVLRIFRGPLINAGLAMKNFALGWD
jgi:hypothetical protein